MKVQICDKCGKQFGSFPAQAVQFPIVEVKVLRNYASCAYGNDSPGKIDLCNDCMKKVYEFIFGEELK